LLSLLTSAKHHNGNIIAFFKKKEWDSVPGSEKDLDALWKLMNLVCFICRKLKLEIKVDAITWQFTFFRQWWWLKRFIVLYSLMTI
jgi:hypothetical protein